MKATVIIQISNTGRPEIGTRDRKTELASAVHT